MKTAYLALGSNLGDCLDHLRFAVAMLEKNGVVVAEKSRIYTTQSVEGGGEGDFLNAALRISTELDAPQLLRLCQQIEMAAGRETAHPGQHRGGSRPLDLDILLFEGVTSDNSALELPHPRALSRNFVLAPLLDVLEGGWIEPTPLKW